MRWMLVLVPLALAGVHMLSLGACANAPLDETAQTEAPFTLAIGAFHRITIQDACPGGMGKLDFCRPERVVSIDEVRASPAGIVEVHPISDVPSELHEPGVEWVVLGVRPGHSTVTIEATFDDGGKRSAQTDVTAVRAMRAVPMIGCAGSSPYRFPAGDSVGFHVRLFSFMGTELAGTAPGLLAGPGLSLTTDLRATSYTWQAPESSGDVVFLSPGLLGFELVLGSYQPDDVTIVGGAIERAQVPAGLPLIVRMTLSVRGAPPCALPELAVTTQTPEVCTGPDGATSWVDYANGDVVVHPVTSGACRLDVGVVGASETKEIEVVYELYP